MLLAGLLGAGLHLSKIILVMSQQTRNYHRRAEDTGWIPSQSFPISAPIFRHWTPSSSTHMHISPRPHSSSPNFSSSLQFSISSYPGDALLGCARLTRRHCFQHSLLPGSPSVNGTQFSRLRNSFFSTSHVQPFPWPAHSLCYQYLPFYFFSFSLNSRLIVSSLCFLVIAFLPSCLDSSDLCRLFFTHSCQLNQKEPSSCRSHNLWLPQQGLDVLSVLPAPSALRASSACCSPNMGLVLQPGSFVFRLQHTACLFLWLAHPKN